MIFARHRGLHQTKEFLFVQFLEDTKLIHAKHDQAIQELTMEVYSCIERAPIINEEINSVTLVDPQRGSRKLAVC